ncbi:hypothetical protein Q5H93_04670 [Hymenobacter sp. ASUV-10]|uniref:Uncharacterized protein n=1 Tax=Hymenobacter aranciens TaxID=3063996 RepID=A0ABT9BBU0_9BACT|nr:hypothetical protein [Hymenobacter sp. ASUV-10]MDO7874018.1 hypothetical protein [Hymenobacter sp. ASUV-10]
MHKYGPYRIEKITITSIRNWILDNEITEEDTILLNSYNFDDLVLEFRATYDKPISEPYHLLGILVDEAVEHAVPLGSILLLKGGNLSSQAHTNSDTMDDGSIIFRCGWCGNVVDESGKLLSSAQEVV